MIIPTSTPQWIKARRITSRNAKQPDREPDAPRLRRTLACRVRESGVTVLILLVPPLDPTYCCGPRVMDCRPAPEMLKPKSLEQRLGFISMPEGGDHGTLHNPKVKRRRGLAKISKNSCILTVGWLTGSNPRLQANASPTTWICQPPCGGYKNRAPHHPRPPLVVSSPTLFTSLVQTAC